MPKNPLLISKSFVLYSHCLFNTCVAVTTTAAVIPTAATLLITSTVSDCSPQESCPRRYDSVSPVWDAFSAGSLSGA